MLQIGACAARVVHEGDWFVSVGTGQQPPNAWERTLLCRLRSRSSEVCTAHDCRAQALVVGTGGCTALPWEENGISLSMASGMRPELLLIGFAMNDLGSSEPNE
jgi:hypothetical protein